MSETKQVTKHHTATAIRERLFVAHYLEGLNATEAAKYAGFSDVSAQVQGSMLLRRPHVKALVEKGLRERGATPDEVIARLTEISRADLIDFMSVDDDTGYIKPDIRKAKRLKRTGLIKKLKFDKDTGHLVEIELHDKLQALAHLGKVHALFTEKVQVSGTVEVQHKLVREKMSAAMSDPTVLKTLMDAAERISVTARVLPAATEPAAGQSGTGEGGNILEPDNR